MISEVVVGHGTDCCGLILVALEHSCQAHQCKDGNVYETNTGGGDGVLCLECLGGLVIPFTIMVGHSASCCGPRSTRMVTVSMSTGIASVLKPTLRK